MTIIEIIKSKPSSIFKIIKSKARNPKFETLFYLEHLDFEPLLLFQIVMFGFWIFVFKFLGDHSEGVTPVPIPNTEVKPFSADGTAWEAVWESRTLPGLKLVFAKAGIKSPSEMMGFFVSDV